MKLFERKQVFSRSGSTPLKNYSRDKKKNNGNDCKLEMHFYDIVYKHEYSA